MLANFGFADPDKQNPRHDLTCQYLAQRAVADRAIRMVFPEIELPQPHQAEWIEQKYCSSDKIWFEERGSKCLTVASFTTTLEQPLHKGIGQYRTTIGFLDLVIGVTFQTKIDCILRKFGPVATWMDDEHCYDSAETVVARIGELVSKIDSAKDSTGQKWLPTHSDSCSFLYQARAEHNNPSTRSRGLLDFITVESAWAHLRPLLPTPKYPVKLVHEEEKSFSTSSTATIVVEVKIHPDSAGTILRQINFYRDYMHADTRWVLVVDFDTSPAEKAMYEAAGIGLLRLSPAFDEWAAAQQAMRSRPPADHRVATI